MEREQAGGAPICSLCSFGEYGQTVRGIDLNPLAYDQKRYLTSRGRKNLIKKEEEKFLYLAVYEALDVDRN